VIRLVAFAKKATKSVQPAKLMFVAAVLGILAHCARMVVMQWVQLANLSLFAALAQRSVKITRSKRVMQTVSGASSKRVLAVFRVLVTNVVSAKMVIRMHAIHVLAVSGLVSARMVAKPTVVAANLCQSAALAQNRALVARSRLVMQTVSGVRQ